MPITKEQILSGKHTPKLRILNNGGFGAGKTYFSMTFPKWKYAMIEPNGITTAISNPHLLKNMVDYEELVPSKLDIKECFVKLQNYVIETRKQVLEGVVETFILDNLTHLSENRWIYIDTYERAVSGKSGKTDTLSMYGNLGRWLYRFVVTELLSLPCHVVVNVHEMEEEEEQVQSNGQSKRVKTGKVITNTLGGFRKDAAGLFNANLFLECAKTGPDKYVYRARCRPGGGKAAKNNLGLPEFVDDISYDKLMDSIGLYKEQTKKGA